MRLFNNTTFSSRGLINICLLWIPLWLYIHRDISVEKASVTGWSTHSEYGEDYVVEEPPEVSTPSSHLCSAWSSEHILTATTSCGQTEDFQSITVYIPIWQTSNNTGAVGATVFTAFHKSLASHNEG